MQAVTDDELRFWSKTMQTDTGCLVWTSALTRKGYGKFSVRGVTVQAHRYAWQSTHGAIPDGLHIDHLCRNRACQNTSHMELVTNAVNMARGNQPNAVRHRTDTCGRGHSLIGARVRRNGTRCCRLCERHRYHRKRAQLVCDDPGHANPTPRSRAAGADRLPTAPRG